MGNSLHPKLIRAGTRESVCWVAAVAALALLAWPAWAQYTGQAKSSRLRAVGVLRIDGKGVARLFPVVFYADGKYYDARLYQANPVPSAISGDIFYQAQKDGHPEGSFTVHAAMHTSTQWWAEGLWKPGRADDAKVARPARQAADSDRPVLHRRSASSSSESSGRGPRPSRAAPVILAASDSREAQHRRQPEARRRG